MTADELEAEGRRLRGLGHLVVFLYPSQEWLAVKTQTPFLRYGSRKSTDATQREIGAAAEW
jgi:hypothetical protein